VGGGGGDKHEEGWQWPAIVVWGKVLLTGVFRTWMAMVVDVVVEGKWSDGC
jgi:hypothetical protein